MDNARLYGDAQEANRAKDELLANLSHELRTPMTAILDGHLLQVADLEPDQVKLGLQTIRQSGEAQAKLIDDLLDVSRIVTGKLHLNPTAVRLSDIARGAIAAIHPASDAKRQHLEVDILAGDAMVLGDASRLQQVFWNLLSNAVKFTPPGGVVRVRLVGPDADNVVLTVQDTGEGIPRSFCRWYSNASVRPPRPLAGGPGWASDWPSQKSSSRCTAVRSPRAAGAAAAGRPSPSRCRGTRKSANPANSSAGRSARTRSSGRCACCSSRMTRPRGRSSRRCSAASARR